MAPSASDCLVHARRILGGVADVCFPRFCPVCREPSDRVGRLLCWNCFGNLPLREGPVCGRCGLQPEGRLEGPFICSVCQQSPPAFDCARAAAAFRGGARELLHRFKYSQGVWLCRDLADLLQGCVEAHFDYAAIDAVLPVPLHPRKQRQRTYNQATALAAELAARLRLPLLPDAARRVRLTPTQTRLSAAARRDNVRGAFQVVQPEWVRARTLLLVDDVMTTGATLHELAAALKRAGAWRVWAATVARG